MITNISTGHYNVIESNTVYLFKSDADLELDFKFGDFGFKIIFLFVDNEEIEGYKLASHGNENLIEFTCTNFNNILGTGTTSPIEIAMIDNKKLYIHFWSYTQGNSDAGRLIRKVEYTVFLER